MNRLLGIAPLLACLAALPAQRARNEDAETLAKLLQQYDKDKDGKVQRTEYPRTDAAFTNLDRDRSGVIDAADFATPAKRPPRSEMPFADETKLPKVGELAPDFELPMLGMKDTTVKLSSFRGDRPVALIFGSWT